MGEGLTFALLPTICGLWAATFSLWPPSPQVCSGGRADRGALLAQQPETVSVRLARVKLVGEGGLTLTL